MPDSLNGHENPHHDWHHPQLFMSQTCGYPLRYEFSDTLEVIAVPRYRTEGCEGVNYSSMVVARYEDRHLSLSDFADRRLAYNVENSQSGYSAMRAVIAPLANGQRFFSKTLKTGVHLKSMAAVVEKKADVCAIDCVVWGLAKRIFPELVQALCVIAHTPMAPSLPYVTLKTCSPEDLQALRRGLLKSAEDPAHKDLRALLLIESFDILPGSVYERIEEIETAAIAVDYPVLH